MVLIGGYGIYIQLFRERLSEKVHATIRKVIVGGFESTVLQRKLIEWKERPWTCLRVLKEATKSLVLIKYPILPFGIVTCTFFSDNLSRNSCI